jgi:hypothetical protein
MICYAILIPNIVTFIVGKAYTGTMQFKRKEDKRYERFTTSAIGGLVRPLESCICTHKTSLHRY